MKTIPVILPRRAYRHKKVDREGCIRFQVEVTTAMGLLIGISAEAFWINWGDGWADSDLIHTYDVAGTYDVVISGIAINQLNLAHCWLKSIDLSGCPWLEYVDISFNFLKELDISSCPELMVLHCSRNLIRELKLGDHLPLLFYLDCSSNLIEVLEFPRFCGLQYLLAYSNHLFRLHFRHCPDLHCIDLTDNDLSLKSLQKILNSLPVVSPEWQAWLLYGLNPSTGEVEDRKAWEKGWHCDRL